VSAVPAQPAASVTTSSTSVLLRRLLAFAWGYRRSCVKVLSLQVVLLTIGLLGLGLTGFGLDLIRAHVQPGAPEPQWPLGLSPPATWSSMAQLG
jgi:ATP-binding cassette subfamily B protein